MLLPRRKSVATQIAALRDPSMAASAPEDHAGPTSDAPPSPRSARTRFSNFVHRVHDKFGKASGPQPIVDQTRRTSVQKCSAALLTDPGLDAYFLP